MDPPSERQKAITPKFLRKFFQFLSTTHGHGPPSTLAQHTADLVLGTFFFAMRSCEYTKSQFLLAAGRSEYEWDALFSEPLLAVSSYIPTQTQPFAPSRVVLRHYRIRRSKEWKEYGCSHTTPIGTQVSLSCACSLMGICFAPYHCDHPKLERASYDAMLCSSKRRDSRNWKRFCQKIAPTHTCSTYYMRGD
jgi:hypothetical protein